MVLLWAFLLSDSTFAYVLTWKYVFFEMFVESVFGVSRVGVVSSSASLADGGTEMWNVVPWSRAIFDIVLRFLAAPGRPPFSFVGALIALLPLCVWRALLLV